MAPFAAIQSSGDLEVVLLHEANGVLADIIGPNLYTIYGTAPEQDVTFKSEQHFNLFLILLVELTAEGSRSAFIGNKYENWSLLRGLRWFCSIHDDETKACLLQKDLHNLETWINSSAEVTFWCPDVEVQLKFPLLNSDLISFGANTTKHHLIRLSAMVEKLHKMLSMAGYTFTAQETVGILSSMTDEVRNRLRYHATYVLELLGNLFESLNALIDRRFRANPTNRVDQMIIPEGVTSDVFHNLYGSVLVFKRYAPERIRDFTPTAMRFLRQPYR
jgi:hypothetical protein